MTLEELKLKIVQSNIVEINNYIAEYISEIKLLFGNMEVNNTNTAKCIQLISYIHNNRKNGIDSQQIQFLITILAFYFKDANRKAFTYTCIGNLKDTILKFRLQAWYKYKIYVSRDSHLKLFPKYLDILSKAISDDQEEYIDDVLQDLHTYNSEYGHIPNFQDLFNDELLLSKYPLLREYKKRKGSLDYKIELHENIDKIYSPSVFTEQLFENKFISYIRNHPKTKWNKILLGYDKFAIRSDVIKFGQANFDNIFEELSSIQVVKLYCYFNMRKHYYSSLYLFERCPWIKNVLSKNGCAKFIDIGCGPATSGIALTDYLLSTKGSFKPFDYIGVDFYQSMLDVAADLMTNEVYKFCSAQHYVKSMKSINADCMKNANSILLNACYVFASPSLDPDDLAKDVNNLLITVENKPRFLLFQNTTDSLKNTKYKSFKSKLIAHEILLSDKLTIKYNNQRNSFYPPVHESVYFEVLKF